MKRSSMVQVIAIELMSRLPEWEKQERLNFASEILQAIEIEGMKPPETNGTFTVEDMKNMSNECEFDIGDEWTGYEWEPEDEI